MLQKQEVRLITSRSREGLAEEANRLGEQGWELVDVVVDDSCGARYCYAGYLKRPKQ